MGKAEAGTPKDISNRMKLKGLQKLKFYCQMCKKQCRDQNGFDCHMKSSTHLGNMRLFAENPNDFIAEYSRNFEKDFLELLSKRHLSKRVLANSVYKEFISDKQHTHMNGTRWSTLTGFIMYLKDSGKIEADSTDRGLFITYIDKSFDATKAQREEEKKIRLEQKSERIRQAEIEREMAHAQKLQETMVKNAATRNQELDEAIGEDIAFSLGEIGNTKNVKKEEGISFSFDFCGEKNQEQNKLSQGNQKKNELELKGNVFNQNDSSQQAMSGKELEAAEALLKKIKANKNTEIVTGDKNQEISTNKVEQDKEIGMIDEDEDDFEWLLPSIHVKIKDKDLENGKFYNEKAVVKSVKDFVGEIELLKSNVKLNIDQSFLETVIPKLGGAVLILQKGQNRGKTGILESINADNYEGVISLKDYPGQKINVPYEMFSKI